MESIESFLGLLGGVEVPEYGFVLDGHMADAPSLKECAERVIGALLEDVLSEVLCKDDGVTAALVNARNPKIVGPRVSLAFAPQGLHRALLDKGDIDGPEQVVAALPGPDSCLNGAHAALLRVLIDDHVEGMLGGGPCFVVTANEHRFKNGTDAHTSLENPCEIRLATEHLAGLVLPHAG